MGVLAMLTQALPGLRFPPTVRLRTEPCPPRSRKSPRAASSPRLSAPCRAACPCRGSARSPRAWPGVRASCRTPRGGRAWPSVSCWSTRRRRCCRGSPVGVSPTLASPRGPHLMVSTSMVYGCIIDVFNTEDISAECSGEKPPSRPRIPCVYGLEVGGRRRTWLIGIRVPFAVSRLCREKRSTLG